VKKRLRIVRRKSRKTTKPPRMMMKVARKTLKTSWKRTTKG
jgi:hypothetical protein